MLAPVLTLLFILYVVVVAFFLILENRRPQSTYAWLLAFAVAPVISVILYLFTGRGWRAFSQERKLAQNAIGDDFRDQLVGRVASVPEIKQALEDKARAQSEPLQVNPNLMRLVGNNVGSVVTGFNEAQILQDADQFYPRLLEDMRQAQHHIHLQYYIWTEDDFTQEVKAVLTERARAGVKVRALYDASNKLSKEYIDDMRSAGVEFLPYLAYNSLRTLHLANYRCHRKITIIDGRIGYLGGMNLDREQMPGVAWPRWRDTQVRIHGEAALALQVVFLAAWYNTTGKQLDDLLTYFPAVRDEVNSLMPVQITASGPDSQWHGIRQLYFYLIVSARDHCYIQSPFFIPDETISEAMKSAALSGVDVRMICTPRGHKYQIPYRAANTYFREMAEAGVKIYLYDGGYYHSKTISIDGAVCTIGSCNMDIRSYNVNYELNAVLHDPDQAQRLEADFLADLEHCTQFSLEEYEKRSIWERFVDSVYRLTSPLL